MDSPRDTRGRRRKGSAWLASVTSLSAAALALLPGRLTAQTPATCVVSGTILDGGGAPIANAPVRLRVISPTILTGGQGVAAQDLTVKTNGSGVWSATLLAGLNAQADIPALALSKDFVIPTGGSCPAAFGSLTLYNRGTLTPATILSDHGPSFTGDLIGSSPAPTVVGLRGIPIVNTIPTAGQVLAYNASTGKWEPASVGGAGGVASVSAGTGISITGSGTAPVVNVAAGGIGPTQLAAGAAASNVGALGGDLTSTLPNPQIAPGVIVNADVNAAAAIDWTKISKAGAIAADVGAVALGAGMTSIGAGSGITVTGAAPVPTVSITNAGVTSGMLASGAAASNLGSAGGALTGSYPSPTLGAGVVADANVASGAAIAQSKIAGLTSALALKEDAANKGQINGYASLDGSGKVPSGQLPASSTPSAHASTHASVGSDPVSPVSIGAANLSHTHAESDVTSLVTDLAGKGGLTTANTWTSLQTFSGGISVPGGFSPGGPLTVASGNPIRIALTAPGLPTLTPSASGGSLASATYYYVVTALDGAGGETLAGPEASTPVTGPTGSVLVQWSAVPGATYRVWRGTSSGAEGHYFATASTSLTDTGATGTSGTLPVSGTAYAVRLSPTASSWTIGGSLGIGTSTPSTALHVAGTATASAFVGPLTGNADTATALAANPANCGTGLLPRGVAASGAAEGCAAVDLAAEVTSVLPVANGGTGASTASGARTALAVVPLTRILSTTAPLAIDGGATADLSADRSLTVANATTGAVGVMQLTNDLGGTGTAPTVQSVGGQTAANVASAAVLANAATSSNTASAIVRRDGSGNFSAGTISANLAGNATSASDGLTSASGTAPLTLSLASKALTGSVAVMSGASSGSAGATGLVPQPLAGDQAKCLLGNATWGACGSGSGSVSSVALSVPSDLSVSGSPITTSGTLAVTRNAQAANLVLAGPTTGASAAPTFRLLVSADIPNNAANTSGSSGSFTGSLAGDVTGTQGGTVVASVAGSTAANVHAAELLANAATSSGTASTIVRRDATGSGGFVMGALQATSGRLGTAGTPTDALEVYGPAGVATKLKVTGGGGGAYRAEQNGMTTSFRTYDAADSLTGTPLELVGTGAAARGKLWDKGGAVFNVRSYGAVGDGVTDDTSAISSAVSAASAGGVVYFPPGSYLFSTLSVTTANLTFAGAGQTATVLSTSSTTGTALSLSGSYQRIRDLTIDAPGVGTASQKNLAIGGYATQVENVTLTSCKTCLEVTTGGGYSRFAHLILQDQPPSASTRGLHVNGAAYLDFIDLRILGNNWATAAIDVDASFNPVFGISFRGVQSESISNELRHVYIHGTNIPTAVRFTDLTISNASTGGGLASVEVDGSDDVTFQGGSIVGGTNGVKITGGGASAGYTFANFAVSGAGEAGYRDDTTARIRLVNFSATDCALGASGVASGLLLGANARDKVIFGGRSSGADQAYGLFVTAGADRFFVEGMDLSGNLTGPANTLLGPSLASASSITPTCTAHRVTGTTTIQTIAPLPYPTDLLLIPGGAWALGTGGNIATAISATVDVPLRGRYDASTAKWYFAPTGIPSLTAGSIAYAGTNGSLTQTNASLFWDASNKRLGLGTNAPATDLHLQGVDAADAIARIQSAGTSAIPTLSLRRSRGTAASPSAVSSGDTVARLATSGYTGAAYSSAVESLGVVATETWAGSSNGRAITLSSVANGAATATERMRIGQDGKVGIGTAAPAYTLDVAGATNSTSRVITASTGGALWTQGSWTESITLSTGGTTTDSTNDLPAGSLIMPVGCRVTTGISTATAWSVGDPTTAARFLSTGSALTAGTTAVGLNHWKGAVASDAAGPTQSSTAKLRITTTGTPTGGVVECTVFYSTFAAPTS